MQVHPIERLKLVIRRYRIALRDGFLLLALMSVATLIAYQYDIFPNAPGLPTQEHVIELDEAIALAGLFCAGLFALSWRRLLREVARRTRAEHRARELALQDPLTGLPNRRQFDQELRTAIAGPPRIDGAHAVFLLDLDNFKHVNDVYGHGVGDEVLINVARRLKRADPRGRPGCAVRRR